MQTWTRRLAILALLLTISTSVSAQDSLKAIYLTTGTTAPFTGYLLTESMALKAIKDEELKELYRKKLDEALTACTVPWYRTPEFNRWLGFVLGAAVASLAVYGAGQLHR